MTKYLDKEIAEDKDLYCVYCGTVLDSRSQEVIKINGKCPYCSNDLEEIMSDSKFDEIPVNIDEIFMEVKFHILEETTIEAIKEQIGSIKGEVESIEVTKDFLYEISTTKEGKRLIDSFNKSDAKLDEFIVTASFILDNKGKVAALSNLLTLFPTCVLREEGSNYIICKNKGIAKLVLDYFEKDITEAFACLMTGYDKYRLISNFITYAGPLNLMRAKIEDIFLLWENNALLCGKEFESKGDKVIPGEWLDYLEDLTEIKISCDKDDAGEYFSISEMLEECIAEASDNESLTICSVRGCEEILKEKEVK